MRLDSRFVPQADRLQDVVLVLQAVSASATTFQEIANYMGKVDRQGRYYRLAAETLGLISNSRNHANLTTLGKKFLEVTQQEQITMLKQIVLNSRLFKRIVPFLELHPRGVTKQTLEMFMSKVTQPVGESMMDRRVSTVLSWLGSLNLIAKRGTRYLLTGEIGSVSEPVEYDLVEEPLFPRGASLQEYIEVAGRAKKAKQYVSILRNEAKMERASNQHRRLVNLVANRIRSVGVLPRFNQLIDLAARVKNIPYLFEMKSLTIENVRSQVRTGVSQLYEYRYLQNTPDAGLVLIVETELPQDLTWMQHFLERDRNIRLVWDGNDQLYASAETKKALSFLW